MNAHGHWVLLLGPSGDWSLRRRKWFTERSAKEKPRRRTGGVFVAVGQITSCSGCSGAWLDDPDLGRMICTLGAGAFCLICRRLLFPEFQDLAGVEEPGLSAGERGSSGTCRRVPVGQTLRHVRHAGALLRMRATRAFELRLAARAVPQLGTARADALAVLGPDHARQQLALTDRRLLDLAAGAVLQLGTPRADTVAALGPDHAGQQLALRAGAAAWSSRWRRAPCPAGRCSAVRSPDLPGNSVHCLGSSCGFGSVVLRPGVEHCPLRNVVPPGRRSCRRRSSRSLPSIAS